MRRRYCYETQKGQEYPDCALRSPSGSARFLNRLLAGYFRKEFSSSERRDLHLRVAVIESPTFAPALFQCARQIFPPIDALFARLSNRPHKIIDLVLSGTNRLWQRLSVWQFVEERPAAPGPTWEVAAFAKTFPRAQNEKKRGPTIP